MDWFRALHQRISPNTGFTVTLKLLNSLNSGNRVFTCERRMPVLLESTGYPQEATVYVNSVEIWSGTLTEDFPEAQFDIYDYIAGRRSFSLGLALDDGYISEYKSIINLSNTVCGMEALPVTPDALRWDADRSDAWLCLWSTDALTYQVAETLVTLPKLTAAQAYMNKGWAFVDGAATLLRKISGGMMVFWQCKDTGLMKGWCFEVVGRGVLGADVKRNAGGLRQETRDCSHYVEVRTTGCSARDAAYLRSLNYSDDIGTADDSESTTLYLLDDVPTVAYGERETISLRFEIITVS